MKRFFLLISALWFGLSVAGTAQSPVVIELYTSQGCSSCPPADAIFREVALREDVIALSLHVDYWDYIGWKDEFADPRHAKRQRAFARKAQRRSIYTPQMIINGDTNIVGAKPMRLIEAIAKHAAKPVVAQLMLERSGDDLRISSTPATIPGPFTVHLLRYTPMREARITRGENAGHTLQYANVVEGWTVLGQWDGTSELSLSTQLSGEKPVVILIQHDGNGHVVSAARLN